MRRATAVLAIVFGITLIGCTFAEHLFARSHDAQTIADQYAPLMSAKGLHDLTTGFDAVKAAGGELATSAEPRLQQALGMSDTQFKQYVARELPGIAKFDAQAPGVVELVGPVIGKMVAVRDDYTRSSEIPVSWRRSRARRGCSWVSARSSSASARTRCGRRARSRASRCCSSASGSRSPLVNDVHTKLEPALEQRLGAGEFAQQFPTLANWVESWQRSISAQSHDLSDSQVAFASTFTSADKIPLEPTPWMFIIPGFVLAMLAGVSRCFRRGARQRRVPRLPR